MARAGGAGSAHLSGIHLSEQNAPDPRSQATPPPPSVHDVRDRDVRVRLHVAYGQYGLVRFNPPGSPGASACLGRTRFDPPDSPDASHCASERLVHTRLSAHAGSSPLSAPVRASQSAVCVWGTTQGGRSACTLPNHARPVPRAHPRRRARPGGGARSSLPPTPLPIVALYTPGPHTPARAPCQPLSGVSVPRLRVVHDTSGEIRLNPTPRRRARPGMWSALFVSICTARTLSEPFLIFGPQATRGGARHEGVQPLAPCPTTRGRFHRAPPRGRA